MRGNKRHALPEPQNELEVAYMAAMRAENLRPDTIRQRVYLLRGLGRPPGEVTHDDVVDMLNSRQLSPGSRASYVTVLRTIFDDLARLDLVDNDPLRKIKQPKQPRRLPRPIPQDELDKLEAMPHERERHWTILGAYAGLRAGEVVSVRADSLRNGPHGLVVHVEGKGGLVADIPAHPKVVGVLEQYAGHHGPIWDMWPSSLDRAWLRAAESVGVRGRVFHQLRHSFATRLHESGVDLLVIADLCRHASVATTQRYARVASDRGHSALSTL